MEHPEAPKPGEPDLASTRGDVAAGAELAAHDSPPVTHYGGLFYLLGRVLELEIARHLYFAGVLEGLFLAHAVRALLPDDSDVGPAIFGGEPPGPLRPLASVPDWACDEIWSNALGSTLAFLRGRDLACPLLEELEEELDALAAPLRERISAPDERTGELVARVAALLVRVFFARLGEPASLEALAPRIEVRGTVKDRGDELAVVLPMHAVDLELRHAGLDFDPGWVPWLKRKVVLVFQPGVGEDA
jgi:hypothetical protein